MPEKREKIATPEINAAAELDSFAYNPGLEKMTELFSNGALPLPMEERLSVAKEIADQNWDFRKGSERQATDWSNDLLDQPNSHQWNTIFEAADELGLVKNTQPINKSPDMFAVLGGANHAPYDRLKYGLETLDDFGALAYLGAQREVNESERTKAADYAPGAKTEFDLGCAAFEKLLPNINRIDDIPLESVVDEDVWRMRVYEFQWKGKNKYAYALSSPKQIGERRATTYDNYDHLADLMQLQKDPNKSIVAVTTGFYTQGQHLPAVQQLTLKYGTSVETIGHSAEYAGVARKPSQLLQETKAAIDAAVKLQDAIQLSHV